MNSSGLPNMKDGLDTIKIKEAAQSIPDRLIREAVKRGELIPTKLRPYTFLVRDMNTFAETRKLANAEIVRRRNRVNVTITRR